MGDRLDEWVERLNRQRGEARGRLAVCERDGARLALTCSYRQSIESGQGEALIAEIGVLAVKAVCLDVLEPDQDATVIECKFDYQRPFAGTEYKATAHLIRRGRSILVARAEVTSIVAGKLHPLALVQASVMVGTIANAHAQSHLPDQS